MLRTVFLLLVVTLIQHTVAGQDLPGKLVKSRRSFATRFPEVCNPTGHYVQCNSCSSYMVCLSGMQTSGPCPAEKPFCNNNACSATPDYSACPVPSLNCTGSGYYPDPKACQFYHYCDGNGANSDVYECPRNYVFNPVTTLCRQNVDIRCDSVQCDPDKILQRYGNSDNYFVFCRDQEILMAKCDDFHVFNGTSCEFLCVHEGRYPHPDSSRYYQCYFFESKLVSQEMTCPLNKVYDARRGVCLA
ncbi:conserved hypothetical protein [Culex quinquefasciatus]|uniref:Chitin-binding type-2 domain-containing protein n=1 Tax=Culex quinquefasciatus TaxID=7176 RepID=B0X3K2_CULQU|nr:conserved hypothetical protein [Culex quinquefasciatus]|eukprot:XP_001864224.1 conserved hypothetical protein [Culex quinquefasciatus]